MKSSVLLSDRKHKPDFRRPHIEYYEHDSNSVCSVHVPPHAYARPYMSGWLYIQTYP